MMADPKDREQGAEAQREFKKAGNMNVVQRAGEGLDSAGSSQPVPGNRLTTPEVEAEAGRTEKHDPARGGDAGRRTDPAAKADEREALRRQGQQETDSNLESENHPEGSTVLEDPVITSNPD